ncbi:TonB-dependent receptor [Phenylobacterium sp. VNQ135]|uniref:TonB-dependent receptor n=1 Tax=Phenylobacterium sp. VNQ135 TaxID=3400922 RepID=UPI003C126C08
MKASRNKSKWSVGLMASTMLTAVAAPAAAQQAGGATLEEVVITAQKRSENLQDVPVSVQALGTERLDQLQVSDMADYVKFLPNVTVQASAPGYNTIYMRGVASGENSNHSGPLPSVAVYLDEQPVTTITGPLDIHVYDIERVEVLAGPQGTLYGASAQAGTIRIITNKPSTSGFEAGYDLELNRVSHGGIGYGVEGFVNQPLSDRAAVRLVGWALHDAGYIDNEEATQTYPTGPVTINNAALADDDFNESDTYGARAALKIDLDDTWSVTPTLNAQRTESDGDYRFDPGRGRLKTARFRPDRGDDKWYQAAMTVEGAVSNLDVVYAGAYMKRWLEGESDYSDYAYFYDTLYGYGAYWYDDAGDNIDISQYIKAKDVFTKQSHELRVATPADYRFRVTAGLFYQKQTHNIQQRYMIDDLASSISVTGWPDTIWLTKQLRVDRDYAAFADASFDVTDQLTINGGIRFFKAKNGLEGFFGYGPGYSSRTGEAVCFGPPIVDGSPCTNLDRVTSDKGKTYRINAQFKFDADRMVYATYSTGYRPGGVNRRGGDPYDPDYLKNLEFGWKTTWMDNRLRWNGALFREKWNDYQFSFLGQNGLTIIANGGKAKMKGVETDLTWVLAEGLTLNGAASYIDAELAQDYRSSPTGPVLAPKGQSLPVTPKFKGSMYVRYEWEMMAGMDAHVQGAVVHNGSAYPDLRSADRALIGKTPAYTTFDLTAGLTNGSWRVEAFAKNLFDEDGQVDRGVACVVCTRVWVTPIRPRIIGLRFGQSF